MQLSLFEGNVHMVEEQDCRRASIEQGYQGGPWGAKDAGTSRMKHKSILRTDDELRIQIMKVLDCHNIRAYVWSPGLSNTMTCSILELHPPLISDPEPSRLPCPDPRIAS